MPNRSKVERNALISTAAGIFAKHTRDAKEIAAILDTSERNIYRWAETPQWEKTLADIGYEGEGSFRVAARRDTKRDYGEVFEKARDLYSTAVQQGHSNWKAAGIAAEALGFQQRTVLKWARRFGWKPEKT